MRLPRLLPLLGLILLPVLVRAAAPVPAAATDAPPLPTEVQKLTLRDAPVQMVLDLLEQWTGRIVLRPQSLQAAVVAINIPHTVPREEAIRAVISVLELNGIGVVFMEDKYIKVLNLASVRAEASQLITGSSLDEPASNQIKMKIFQLTFARPQDIVPQINTLLTPNLGQGLAYTNSNIFSVTDTVANIQRVETLVKQLDHPTNTLIEPKFIALKNSKSSDLATRLANILQGPLQAFAANLSLSYDDRTNQLIVIGVPEQFELINKLVENLDKEALPNTQTKVFPLKTATASAVETTMRTLLNNQSQALTAASQTQNRGQGANARGQGANGTGATNGNARGAGAAGAAGTVGAGAAGGAAAGGGAVAAAGGAAAGGAGAAGAAGGATVAGGGTSASDISTYFAFTSDTRTNSIVATGTPGDLAIVGKIIDGLDSPLPQVRIEVVIVDVSLSDQMDSGISALGLELKNDKLVGINGSATGITLTGAGTITTTSSTFGLIQNIASIAGSKGLTGVVNIATSPTKGISNIISAPTIRTMHSTTASLFVGEQRSFANGTVTAGGTGGTTTTFQAINIGISLTVSPLIGSDGTVQMYIQQSVSNFEGSDANNQPITSTRTTSATVLCKSGDIMVLGGLQRSTNSKTSNMLGGVPILGELLGSKQTIKTRNDLIFFVRPVVTTGSSEGTVEAVKESEALDTETKKNVQDLLKIKPATATAPATGGASTTSPPSSAAAAPSTAPASPRRPR
jgi:general secretion pathway protein D